MKFANINDPALETKGPVDLLKSEDCVYKGQWRNSKKEGYGEATYKDGSTYQGYWK